MKECCGRISSSICWSFTVQRLLDLSVVPHPDGTAREQLLGPLEAATEAALKNEELASLLEGSAPLNQAAGCFASLDDDRCIGECRHCEIPFGKEKSVV